MSRIVWDQIGSRKYEVGVDRGVLYQSSGGEFINGVAWNGLTGVDGNVNNNKSTPVYTGDFKVDMLSAYDEYGGTINAYTYPEEFEACIGSAEPIPGVYTRQQAKSRFGLSYRSLIGNDTRGNEFGYKIHLIYNAEVTKLSSSAKTISESIDDNELSWDFETVPVASDDYDPYSELVIDSTKFSPEFMSQLEDILYGTENDSPRLPTLDELITLFYVEPPVPPDWAGYPHERLFPSSNLYPITKTDDGHYYFTVQIKRSGTNVTNIAQNSYTSVYKYIDTITSRSINILNLDLISVTGWNTVNLTPSVYTRTYQSRECIEVKLTNNTSSSVSVMGYTATIGVTFDFVEEDQNA